MHHSQLKAAAFKGGSEEVTLEAAEHIQTSWLLPSIHPGFLGAAVTFRGQLSQQCALSTLRILISRLLGDFVFSPGVSFCLDMFINGL